MPGQQRLQEYRSPPVLEDLLAPLERSLQFRAFLDHQDLRVLQDRLDPKDLPDPWEHKG